MDPNQTPVSNLRITILPTLAAIEVGENLKKGKTAGDPLSSSHNVGQSQRDKEEEEGAIWPDDYLFSTNGILVVLQHVEKALLHLLVVKEKVGWVDGN